MIQQLNPHQQLVINRLRANAEDPAIDTDLRQALARFATTLESSLLELVAIRNNLQTNTQGLDIEQLQQAQFSLQAYSTYLSRGPKPTDQLH